MSRAIPMLCLTLALGAPGCVHSLGGPRARLERAVIAAPVRVVATAEVVPETASPRDERRGWDERLRDGDPGAVLRERLAARGVHEGLDPADAGPLPPLRLSLWTLGSRSTGLTRALGVPWFLVSVTTLGLVPYREAREYVIELRAVDHGAAPPERIRIVRRSYVVVSWGWTPFVLFGHGIGAPSRPLHMEGLARAIDEALDELLPRGDF